MEIRKVTDAAFRPYGRAISGYDFSGLLKEMERTEKPLDEVIYVPSDAQLESLPAGEFLQNTVYGGLPVQVGYCNGNNRRLNALEYHRSSEVDIAVNDLILLLGKQQDISTDFHYDTDLVEAFYVPAGTAVELYATTLHYAPCSADPSGFRCVIVLPRDTNLDIVNEPARDGEGKLLTARNKWLVAHAQAGIDGAFCGLTGRNIDLDTE